VKPSGPRRSAPEVELCIPVIDEESTKGRRISMMITMHLLMLRSLPERSYENTT
jgi:hypothetical protein